MLVVPTRCESPGTPAAHAPRDAPAQLVCAGQFNRIVKEPSPAHLRESPAGSHPALSRRVVSPPIPQAYHEASVLSSGKYICNNTGFMV